MTVLVIAGPPAVGHNTVAELAAKLRQRVAIVDLDDVRDMIRSPHLAPADGIAGDAIYRLSISIGCGIARGFDAAGMDVLLLDVVPPDTLSQYRSELSEVSRWHTVLLWAPVEVVIGRDIARDPNGDTGSAAQSAWRDRIRMLHRQCDDGSELYDVRLDAELPAEQTARRLAELLD